MTVYDAFFRDRFHLSTLEKAILLSDHLRVRELSCLNIIIIKRLHFETVFENLHFQQLFWSFILVLKSLNAEWPIKYACYTYTYVYGQESVKTHQKLCIFSRKRIIVDKVLKKRLNRGISSYQVYGLILKSYQSFTTYTSLCAVNV